MANAEFWGHDSIAEWRSDISSCRPWQPTYLSQSSIRATIRARIFADCPQELDRGRLESGSIKSMRHYYRYSRSRKLDAPSAFFCSQERYLLEIREALMYCLDLIQGGFNAIGEIYLKSFVPDVITHMSQAEQASKSAAESDGVMMTNSASIVTYWGD